MISRHRIELAEAWGRLKAAGAVDIKIDFKPLAGRTEAQVYRSVTRCITAILNGETKPFPGFGDSKGLRNAALLKPVA